MPLQIIRNDITKVRADAIVNTANPKPRIGSGTDSAIYAAAGEAQLLAERKKIGPIAPGQAVSTGAYALKAKYIIHTVGPAWVDGSCGERDILRRTGEGVCSVNPDRAADPIQYLCLSRFDRVADDIRHISPERLVFLVTGIASDPCIRIGQRRSIIDFGGTSGPDNEWCGVYYQAALSDHDILEMAGDIFSEFVIDRIFGDRI